MIRKVSNVFCVKLGPRSSDPSTQNPGPTGCSPIRPEMVFFTLFCKKKREERFNASNEPPRGELRDSPNDDPPCLCWEFLRIKFHLVFLVCVGPEQDLKKGFLGLALREWTSTQVRGEGLSMTGGLLDRGASPLRPQAGEFSAPDSEGKALETACGCFENAEEFHGRYREGYELHVRGRALHELRPWPPHGDIACRAPVHHRAAALRAAWSRQQK